MRTRWIALASVLPFVASSCGGGGGDAEIGIKRVALALAFAEEDLAVPVEPNVIIRLVPAPPEVQADDLRDFQNPPPSVLVNPFACPTAPPGASATVPVTFAVRNAPTAGTYLRHNTGTITIEGGPFPIVLPYPFVTTEVVSASEVVELESAPGVPPTKVTEYEVKRTLLPGFETTDRFRIGATAVELVRRTTVTSGETTVFEPTPAIDVYVFGVEGSTWRDAGVDQENGTAMVFQGKLEKREIIDVCGEVIDTFRVIAEETTVNLETGQTSGTQSGEPNIYNVATQFGGLLVKADVHTKDTVRDPESGSPVLLDLDYVSTLNDVEPRS